MMGKVLAVVAVMPLTAIADPPAAVDGRATGVSVTVIRGSQAQFHGGPQMEGDARGQATPAGRQERGVIVMRPAPDSFMRETTRLAAEANARAERAAMSEARATNLQLAETLRAVQDAADAVRTQRRTKRYVILVPARARQDPVEIHPGRF